jgi:MFS superfamily sulfate permease-like transporter
MRTLVPDPHDPERKMMEVHARLPECPQLKILRIEGSIYFGAINHVATHFDTLRRISPAQKHLLLIARNMNFVDVAGADLLADEAVVPAADDGADADRERDRRASVVGVVEHPAVPDLAVVVDLEVVAGLDGLAAALQQDLDTEVLGSRGLGERQDGLVAEAAGGGGQGHVSDLSGR